MLPITGLRRTEGAPRSRTLSRVVAGVAAAALACSRQATPPSDATALDAAPGQVPEQVTNGQPAPEQLPAAPVQDGATLPAPATAPTPASARVPAPTPAPVPVTAAVAVAGSEERPLALDAATAIDPASSFKLEVAVHLIDGRLALLDDHDAMVASSGTMELGSAWTRYQLTPGEPLSPGATYTLRLDGASSRDAHDPAGRAFTPVKLQLLIAGERLPPPPRRPRRRRRAR
jgi:hypothetical protein